MCGEDWTELGGEFWISTWPLYREFSHCSAAHRVKPMTGLTLHDDPPSLQFNPFSEIAGDFAIIANSRPCNAFDVSSHGI